MKIKFRLLILTLMIALVSIPGVFATWKYGYENIQDKDISMGLQLNEFKYFYEVVVTKVTPVSSTVTKESNNYIQPTEIRSIITGNAGQKIVYKVDAHNYSKTDAFVFTGVEYNSGIYGDLNKISISVSLDEQGTKLINNNPSSNAHKGTAIEPGEDFVFYVTYTLTGNISSGEILVDYTFKPIIYSVTYLHNNQTFEVEHITNNSTAYTVISDKPIQSGAAFAGWVNVNAVVINSIPANNTSDYTLSASWDKVYLIIFADTQGNVLYQEQFTSSSTALSSQGQAIVDQILADLNAEAEKEHMSVSWSSYTIKGAKDDITVKAIYAYNGVLNLVPVYEQPDDGIVDYYRVEAVDSLPETVVVPGNVGGVPIKMVKRITNIDGEEDWNNFEKNVKTIIIEEGVESIGDKNDKEHNGNALAWTPNLTTVYLPSTLTYLGKNTFSRNIALGGFGQGDDKKVLTIEYNGTKAQWKALINNSDSNWDGGLKDGSVVKCSDGYFELDKGLFSSSWKEKNY